MADIKISELPLVASISSTDILPVVAGSSTSKISLINLANSLTRVTSSISASFAISASWAPNLGGSGPLTTTGSSIYSTTPATNTVNVDGGIYIGFLAGAEATESYGSNFIGGYAGYLATFADTSNFIGNSAGDSATNASFSNFIGSSAGRTARNANNSNFIGSNAGRDAREANYSNFLGAATGYAAVSASNSNFLGWQSGYQATLASNSNFLGYYVGYQAISASNSNFLGYQAGYAASKASNSILIGYQAGYNVAGGSLGISSNNIIIGTNITLADGRKDSINLGGIIFATGSYSNTGGNSFSGSANGRVGINQPLPQYTLDVSGSFRVQDAVTILTQVSMSLNFANDTAAAAGGVPLGGLYRNANAIQIRLV